MKRLFSKLVEKYFNYLERKGKKYVIVSYTGQICGYRYFPLFEEVTNTIFPYPNFMINHGLTSFEDLQLPHSHPWAVVSFIVKGGYSHRFKGVWSRKDAPAMIAMTSNEFHGIKESKPNTYTVFCHWFKKKEWVVDKDSFIKVDNAVPEDFEYSITVNNGDIPHAGVAIIKYTPEIVRKINIRQKAFARLSRNA